MLIQNSKSQIPRTHATGVMAPKALTNKIQIPNREPSSVSREFKTKPIINLETNPSGLKISIENRKFYYRLPNTDYRLPSLYLTSIPCAGLVIRTSVRRLY